MYVLSAFEHSLYVDLALSELEELGVDRERMMAVPLEQSLGAQPLFDTLHRSDGISLFDGGAVLGTVFAVLGASFGFALRWGPIIWGLIGFFGGFLLGLGLDVLLNARRLPRKKAGKPAAEVVLLVRCIGSEFEQVRTILERNHALGVGKVDRS
ncbi:hypothetical protein [Paenibacillus flagellatus]|uniref:hypothetical protein n=1 Tax=Paenibacillus flagellatus TaxID=2211139 RepID=UPI001B882836|nr:hypothetical protein [Paenibacillus flagellatus]